MAMQLESFQRMFASALDDPEQEELLLELVKPSSPVTGNAPGRAGENDVRESPLAATAEPDEVLHQRVGLYRGNARSHWRGALANAYPVLLALVGDAYFDALSLAYARVHPSRSGDLNRFGDALPVFIGEYERDSRFRYFADVARLEWALHVACFAADVSVFTAQQWLELGDERLLDAKLAIHPACTAITSDYAIADIWRAHQLGGAFPQRLDGPTWTLVVRPVWRPTVCVHSEAAHAAFIALQNGRILADALDAAFAIDPAFDFATQWHAWITASAITGATSSTVSRSG
ncbi:DNA-binding domain-containing protein [Burkholderia cepacia]|uniref:HvfC/BufC N-terminal domain-containing protein n=1 Tax=Burkholderia cepacia TaxID=292 RepID=UPI00069FC609|nr:DNA-binding domain-containing protein [Burkholderia cepacia]